MSETEIRLKVADRIKAQCIMQDYGLPTAGLDLPQSPDEAIERFRAIREMWVRLNVWVANGVSQKGVIEFPEARREIKYDLNGKHPEASVFCFKALTRDINTRKNQPRINQPLM
jgi:hypothetical protein